MSSANPAAAPAAAAAAAADAAAAFRQSLWRCERERGRSSELVLEHFQSLRLLLNHGVAHVQLLAQRFDLIDEDAPRRPEPLD